MYLTFSGSVVKLTKGDGVGERMRVGGVLWCIKVSCCVDGWIGRGCFSIQLSSGSQPW